RAAGAADKQKSDVVAEARAGVADANAPLPFAELIQRAFGRHDIAGVRVTVGGAARTAAEAIGARAFTYGERIAFAESPDLHTAAHEAAHVVQQRRGVSVTDGVGADGDAYERHADAVADAVVAGRPAEHML